VKTYTVKELHEILGKAIDNGNGDLIVLVPNNDEDIDAEYATLGIISFDEDVYAEYAYFDQNCGEEEEKYWTNKEEE
jgi:hypothetical protein